MARIPVLPLSCLLAFAGATAIPAADAATVNRKIYFNAAAHCQAALPVYDGRIRKRPLAVQNEGSASAYVTCAIATPGELRYLVVFASSHDGGTHRVECTAISGTKGHGVYMGRGVTTPADGTTIPMQWNGVAWGGPLAGPAGLPNFFFGPYLSVSCLLPPGSGLNNFEVTYEEEIGLV